RVIAAGGILVQALPGGDPTSVREVQHALRTGRLRELLASGERSGRVIAEMIYGGGPLEAIGEERHVPLQCRCSPARIGDMLNLPSTVALDEMIAEGKPAEVTCNYCNSQYKVERSVLERIRSQIAGGPRQSN